MAWEALEDAGIPAETLKGSTAGVFVGLWLNEYESRLALDPEGRLLHHLGTGRYAASGRISYFLDLLGPSMTVDTACSSSLVAVHLACKSLWTGECSLALAGGANTILEPFITVAYSQSKMMAADGLCKFGDARANGYVRSDGAGLIALERLSDAEAAGRHDLRRDPWRRRQQRRPRQRFPRDAGPGRAGRSAAQSLSRRGRLTRLRAVRGSTRHRDPRRRSGRNRGARCSPQRGPTGRRSSAASDR